MKTKPGQRILHRLQKTFPKVKKIIDAKSGILVEVNENDRKAGKKKNPAECALARACVREQKADGAIIGLNKSYIIKGQVATRYNTAVTVGREITSFDRHQDFAEGNNYRLSPISPSGRFTKERSNEVRTPPERGNSQYSNIHTTARVRLLKKD